jgi:exopolysaccharide biosynthesis WecB/TagA/CpsF family protein
VDLYELVRKNVVDVQASFPSDTPLTIVYLNPSTYNYFRGRSHLLSGVTGFRFDGFFMVFILRLFGMRISGRQSFDLTSLAPMVFQVAVEKKYKVFFCGGTDKDVCMFKARIEELFPGIRVCGVRGGYFSDDESESVIDDISAAEPDLVILGLGGVKQERFAVELSKRLRSHIFTCGAFISQTAVRAEYYPKWVKKFGFRWLYRFYREPRVIWRVLRHYPLFVFYVFIDSRKMM